MKPDKPGRPDHNPPGNPPGDLETRLKRILVQMEETLNKHEIEQEILATVKRIEAKLNSGGTSEEQLALDARAILEPIVTKLEQVAS